MKNGKQTALHGVLPVDFEPVWISSIEHLRAFEKAYRDTPLVRRIIGAYVLPDGFPCMRGGLIIPHRIPVVMFSSGKLRIDRHVVEFETAAWPTRTFSITISVPIGSSRSPARTSLRSSHSRLSRPSCGISPCRSHVFAHAGPVNWLTSCFVWAGQDLR